MAKYIFYATKFYEDANSTLKVLSMHNLTTYLNFYFLKALVTNRPCFLAIKFFFFGREGGGCLIEQCVQAMEAIIVRSDIELK